MTGTVTGGYEQSVEVGLRGVRALHGSQLRRDRVIGIVFLVIAPLAALYSIWLVPLFLAFGILLWLGALDPQLMQARMLFRRNPDLRHRVDLSADETGITFRSPTTTTSLKWSRYQRLVEGPDVFVLVYGKDLIHIIPAEAFVTREDADAFRRLALGALAQP